jgi:hypothetical protein
MNIQENNKKLAEFMEYAIIDADGNHKDTDYKYHSDWNWLMVVVEKIETTKNKHGFTFMVKTTGCHCTISSYNSFSQEENVEFLFEKTRFLATYNACLGFVDWYNLNKTA